MITVTYTNPIYDLKRTFKCKEWDEVLVILLQHGDWVDSNTNILIKIQ